MILDAFEQAMRQMIRNPARTFLTSLGILIGVAAVIATVSVGRGATARIEQDLATMGGNLVFVIPGNQRAMGPRDMSTDPFRMSDAEALEQVPGVLGVAPAVMSSAIATQEDLRWRTTVRGSTNVFLDAMALTVAQGRPFEDGEITGGAGVCLLGHTVATELFPTTPPLGGRVQLGEASCVVVGVLSERGEDTFGNDRDDFVLVPISFAQRRFLGSSDVGILFARIDERLSAMQIKASITEVMDERRRIAEGADRDFQVTDTAEMSAMVDQISGVLTSFLAAIAGVSLLVGGIGIMNIMLVSVTERTREIGIRLAIGARARDVLLQFLVESVVLSAIGGLAGVLAGMGLSWGVSSLMVVPLVFDPVIVAVALTVSGMVGVIFGFWPAWRAARMKPIDALRHE